MAGRVCEMVLVIGDRDNWGRRLGAGAIREAMKRASSRCGSGLIAKVHPDNVRSLKVFERSGFPARNSPAWRALQ